ncbi:HAD family hydrolase [Methanosarcina acetivorans]|uniref:HAD family hydrolase n=1 Tax=Methanosarcina acetivorans TaxID=2214 RepID=UPI00200B11FA|nr:HAD family hydrolase [Methanosarcina acetivorans]
MRNLYNKYTLSLADNANADIKNVLKDLGVLQYFSCTDISDDIKISKPDCKFFQYYLDKLSTEPIETIFIGDRLDNDIIPAKVLGIRTIWFKNGIYGILEPKSQSEMSDVIIENAFEILNAVDYIESSSVYAL